MMRDEPYPEIDNRLTRVCDLDKAQRESYRTKLNDILCAAPRALSITSGRAEEIVCLFIRARVEISARVIPRYSRNKKLVFSLDLLCSFNELVLLAC